jgi:hypothetical protein
LTGGSASAVPASMLAAMRVAALSYVSVFTSDLTPAGLLCKLPNGGDSTPSANAREAVVFATASSQTRLKQGLEFLREASVNEPACGVIGKAGIILTVASFAVCRRRILTKDVVASQSYTRALE